MRFELVIIGVILFGGILISTSFEQAWAEEHEYLGDDFFEDPLNEIFGADGSGKTFLLFVFGVAIYALFVWYFYRFISKRDMLPKMFFKLSVDDNPSIAKRMGYVIIYGVSFPIIISIWFLVLAFFVFVMAEGMPMLIAIFVSMSIIAVVRILSYYREDASKEVAKMIPYAILAFLLTSAALYQDPNFFTEKEFSSIPSVFKNHLESIIFAIVVVSIFEYFFRISFMVKRKYRPVSKKILDKEFLSQVEEITGTHFKKMEDKEQWLEEKISEEIIKFKELAEKEKLLDKKIEEKVLEFKKISDKQKEIENQLNKQSKSSDSK